MLDFNFAIQELINRGFIRNEEIILVAREQVSTSTAVMFGAIGAAIASSKSDLYILALSAAGIKVFDIDKDTGKYTGTATAIPKDDIQKMSISGGNVNFITKIGKLGFTFEKRIKGYKQPDQFTEAKYYFKDLKKEIKLKAKQK